MKTKTDTQRFIVASERRQLLALGRERGWPFRVLGFAPMPEHPFRVGDWLVVPAHLDSSPLPISAMQRIQAIYAAGMRPKGFVLVHEAPLLLPKRVGERAPAGIEVRPKPDNEQLRRLARTGAGVLGTAAVATGAIALGILALALLLPTLLVVGAIALDPILVAVLDDGAWVEIDRWEV